MSQELVDLHCHILPGIDDGPVTIEDSLKMGRMASADGIERIVTGTHIFNGVHGADKRSILRNLRETSSRFKEEGIEVELLPGAEIHLVPEILEALDKGELPTICEAGKYILLELPQMVVPSEAEELIFSLRLKGVVPIITHPERNAELISSPERTAKLVKVGSVLQVTASSLRGEFGWGTRRVAERMLKNRLAHLVATDAHDPVYRPPRLSDIQKVLASLVGKSDGERVLFDHPTRILRGEPLDLSEPRKRGLGL